MKNIFKSVLVMMAAVSVIACNVDNIGQTFSTDSSNCASFLQKVISNTELPASTTTFPVAIGRSNASGAATVNISSTLPEGVCPSSVSFAAGESEVMIPLNLTNLEVGTTCTGTITLEGQEEFANTSIKITLAKAYTWVKYGTGTYHYNGDDCFFEGDDSGLEIWKAEGFDVYYITKWAMGVDFNFSIGSDGYLIVKDGPIGYEYPGYGPVRVMDCSNYFKDWDPKADGMGFYDAASKTFYFSVVYYVSAGYFGYGFESFEMD